MYQYQLPQQNRPQQQYQYTQSYQLPTQEDKKQQTINELKNQQQEDQQLSQQQSQSDIQSSKSSYPQDQSQQKPLLNLQQSILIKNLRVLQILLIKQQTNINDEYQDQIDKYIRTIKQSMILMNLDNQQLKTFLEQRRELQRINAAYQSIIRQNIDNSKIVSQLSAAAQDVQYLIGLVDGTSLTTNEIVLNLQKILEKYNSLINQGGCPTDKWRGFEIIKGDIEDLQQQDQFCITRQDLLLEDLKDLYENDIKNSNWSI